MITKIQSYRSSDGSIFATIEEAQRKDLELLFASQDQGTSSEDVVLKNRDKIIDILTTTPSSKPKARAINGGRKKRAAKNEQTATFQTATPAAPAA